ncbi:MAG: hypothetical protein JRC90_08750 [Deltaproteobacteria bacterium]|nr:hypothetical protein [Deltaproteobacteria bacterium]
MRFEETYGVWTEKRLSQEEAARILGDMGINLGTSCLFPRKLLNRCGVSRFLPRFLPNNS